MDCSSKEDNTYINLIQNNAEFVTNLNNKIGKTEFMPNYIPFIQLHGSLLRYETDSGSVIKFNRIRNALTYPDLYQNIINKRALIIFPGREHLVQEGRWDLLHRFYEDHLVGECLFIGYSFRHEEMNNQIKYNLNNGRITKLGVFTPNPDNNLGNLFENENIPDNVIRIKGEFGTRKGMDEFIEKWWMRPRATSSYSSKEAFYVDVKNWLNIRNKIYS